MTVASTAYGNFTVIDHGVIDGKRITTAYAHQAQFLVGEGQAVTKGQQIGVVGATGYATGPHLHLEVREDGAVVDPTTWLARARLDAAVAQASIDARPASRPDAPGSRPSEPTPGRRRTAGTCASRCSAGSRR